MIVDDLKILLNDLKKQYRTEAPIIDNEKLVVGVREYVLETDVFSQSQLVEIASKYHPNCLVISEELDNYQNISDHKESMVVIDPLDGTHNYLYGIPMWGLSYTVFSESKVAIESYIGLPMLSILISFYDGVITLYSLDKDDSGQVVDVSETELPISQQMIAFDNQFYKDPKNSKKNFDLIVDNAFTARISGSAVFDIAMIVLGKLSCRIWHSTEIYDVAPAFAFIKNFGSLINLYNGEEASLDDKAVIATMDTSLFNQLEELGVTTKGECHD
jgi:myo-inositol-1(or 4)-monophosphatase